MPLSRSSMPESNPYSSPTTVAVSERAVPLPAHTRLITRIAILISIFALLATYGYPAKMTPFWYFYLLPLLALLTVLLTSVGLGRRVTHRFSILPLVLTLTIVSLFAIIVAVLSQQSWVYLVGMTPRLIATVVGWTAATISTMFLHGATDGRRGLVFANGTAILQASTSIADTITLAFGPW